VVQRRKGREYYEQSLKQEKKEQKAVEWRTKKYIKRAGNKAVFIPLGMDQC
jgi:hypothetical protein